MAGAFNIAISGLHAQEDALEVISNNIANSQTTAFKANTITFQEAYVNQTTSFANGNHNQFGNGVSSAGVTTDWGTGSIVSTGSDSNMAISSDGFFLVYSNGQVYYTRAGDFSLTTNPSYDSSYAPGGANYTEPPGTQDIRSVEYVFMNSNGAILVGGSGTTAAKTVANVQDGSASSTLVSLVGFTPSAQGNSGAPSAYTIDTDGTVTCEPSNTVRACNAKIGIQRFNNPDTLTRTDGGLYLPSTSTSYNTGSATALAPSVAGNNGAGTVVQGSLEASNVDLVSEFTSMITAQRSFQANAKVITTQNELYQTIIQMMA